MPPTRAVIQDVATSQVIFPFSGSNLTSGSVPNAALQASVTLQGNTFNGDSELVQLESDGKLPVLDGSNLTGVISSPTGPVGGDLTGMLPDPTIANVPSGIPIAGTPVQKGVSNSVWIAVRTDGKSGTGTETDPFDGSTQVKFDALMTGFNGTLNTTFHLIGSESGTVYETNGSNDDTWNLSSGCKFMGDGMGRTILKKIHYFPSGGPGNYVIGTLSTSPQDGVEISNLTLDANGGSFTLDPAAPPLACAYIAGDNAVIQNVEAKGFYGDKSGGNECFVVFISSGFSNNNVNGNISGCYVHSGFGDYANGIAMGGNAPFVVQGNIGFNRIEGIEWTAINIGSTQGVRVIGNSISQCGQGVYGDFGPITNAIISNNTINVSGTGFSNEGVRFVSSVNGEMENISIIGNVITGMDGSAPLCVGIHLDVPPTGTAIANNVLILGNSFNDLTSSGTGYIFATSGGANPTAKWTHVTVESNASDTSGFFLDSVDATVHIGSNVISGIYTYDSALALTTGNVFFNGFIEAFNYLSVEPGPTRLTLTASPQQTFPAGAGNGLWIHGQNPDGSGGLNDLGLDPGFSGNLNLCTVASQFGPGGSVIVGGALKLKSGTNAKAGTFTLSSGSATVANTSVTANSVIMVTLKTASGARAIDPLITPTASTGFTAAGTATDNGTYNYVILEVN